MNINLTKFNRLLPIGGIAISPNILYKDVNDVSDDIRYEVRDFFANDLEYCALADISLPKGSRIDRAYCAYVYKDGDLLGNLIFKEALDSPYGYGKNDFFYAKRIYPKYRQTKYSRYASGDMIHMLFRSGIAEHLYSHMRLRSGILNPSNFFDSIDSSMPCLSMLFKTDHPTIQKYMSVKCQVGNYIIVDFDGAIYNSMDLVEYFTAPGHRTKQMAIKWIQEMDSAAEIVKRTRDGCTSD